MQPARGQQGQSRSPLDEDRGDRQSSKPSTLTDHLKYWYDRTRMWRVVALVTLISLSPFIQNPTFKTTILLSLAYLVVDIARDTYSLLHQKLALIMNAIVAPKQVEFSNFHKAEPAIEESMLEVLSAREVLHVHFLLVSGRYSWHFIEDNTRKFLTLQTGKKKAKGIIFDVALVHPKTLSNHRLQNWLGQSNLTTSSIERFRVLYTKELNIDKCLQLNVYYYDNIPHWHGILINGTSLFLGRTDWRLGDSRDKKDLDVGQIEYRFFSSGDTSGGDARIARFKSWFEYYKQRHKELLEEERTANDGSVPSETS